VKQVVFLLWVQGIDVRIANVLVVNIRQNVTRFADRVKVSRENCLGIDFFFPG
jgi:hypothetical protein